MRINIKSFALALAAIAVPFIGKANEKGQLLFTYAIEKANPQNSNYAVGGTGTTDVAVKIPPILSGTSVKGIRIPINPKEGTTHMTRLRGWASRSLNGSDTKQFEPDEVKVDVSETFDADLTAGDGDVFYIDVTFPEPVRVPAAGVYVGYSFLNEDAKYEGDRMVSARPVKIQLGVSAIKGAAPLTMKYISSGPAAGRGYTWTDQTKTYDVVSMLEAVIIDVNGNEVAVNPTDFPVRLEKGETGAFITATMNNEGWNGVKNFEYEFNFNGTVETRTETPDASEPFAIDNNFGSKYTMSVPVPEGLAPGNYPYTITVKKVNGVDHSGISTASTGSSVKVYEKLVEKRPVIEENTGTRCPYCTRGFYALEVMNRLYPDLIAISYHNSWQGSDPMAVLSSPPYQTIGNPDAYTDRMYSWSDYAEDKKTAGMEAMYKDGFHNRAAAEVEITDLKWDDEATKAKLTATATVNFPVEEEARYRIDLILLHDGMTGKGTNWTQSNGYIEEYFGHLFSEPEWDKFLEETTVRGLVYNDIYIASASSNGKGVPGSVPSTIEAGKDYSFTYDFEMDEIRNLSKSRIVQDKTKLRVVALVINATKNVITNACVAKVPGYESTGIEETAGVAEGNKVPVAYYDIMGRRLQNPEKGIVIEQYSDGTTAKRVIR